MCCVIVAGCYRPAELACGITCASGTCPGQLVCNAADQLCYAPASGACTDAGLIRPDDDGAVPGMCYGHDPFKVCVGPPAGLTRWISRTVIDTDVCPTDLGGQYVNVGTVPVCALVATDFDIATTVEVHGSRPLVLVSLGAIAIAGTIDVASHAGKRGPASNTGCIPPAAGTRDMRGIGGAGGSFRGRGGDGAVPAVDGSHPATLALDPIPQPARLIGGCAGGDGSGAAGLGEGSAGGASGGALYLVAVVQVALQAPGWINASGAGGRQVVPNAMNNSGGGGGGGGSGGLIRIDAPTIAINGTIAANGGGGASGAPGAGSGAPGGEPDPAKPEMAALGGAIAAMAGRGGAGNDALNAFAGETPPAPAGDSGGGGGGGGGGHIVLVGTRTGSGVIVPRP
jgi:hypothetical protein